MWDIIYYVFGASCMGVVGIGILNYVDPELASEIKYNIGWSAVKTYHKVNLKCKNIKMWYNKNVIENKPSKSDCEDSDEEFTDSETNKLKFLGYNLNDETSYQTNELENNNYIDDTDFDLMFLKKNQDEKEYYKRIVEKSEINESEDFEKVTKPFLQIEYCIEDNSLSIHKNLDCFYIKGNNILDYNFLMWYMNEFYDIKIQENYILKIIDSDINMFNLKKGDSVRIESRDNSNYLVTSE